MYLSFSSVQSLSRVQLFVTLTVAHQAPPSMGFRRPEVLGGISSVFPSPGVFPDPGIKPGSSALQAYYLPIEPPEKPILFYTW